MTNFPTTIDSFNNPTSTTKTNDPGFDHALQHANANDAIKAIQIKLGISDSTDVDSIDYKIRRLFSRTLISESIGVGDGVKTVFNLPFAPVGDVFVLDGNVRVASVLSEPMPGTFVVTCPTPPVGIVSVIAIKENV
jgi:hypothetical protein